MQPPSIERLEDALAAAKDQEADRCREILDRLIAEGPPGLASHAEIERADASEAEQAWACVTLARERLDQGRLAIVRVSLHSALDHARGQPAEGTEMDADAGTGLFG